jgi:endonuclease G, mitochondrial
MPKSMPKHKQQSFLKPFILLWIAAFFFFLPSLRYIQPNDKGLHIACPLPTKEEQVVQRTAYTFAYNEAHEQANWVAYILTKSQLGSGVERSNRFMEDPLVSTQTATNADYAKSGYDRGHLAPAADMSWSLQVMQESFYYSNMSPQLPGFNRGIWKKLEEKVRSWAALYDTLYVVTGPILESGLPTIGPNQVSVPKAYFKALIAPNQQKGIAFIMPNAKSDLELAFFSVSIDELEAKLHRDLFYQLNDQLEHQLEVQREFWP